MIERRIHPQKLSDVEQLEPVAGRAKRLVKAAPITAGSYGWTRRTGETTRSIALNEPGRAADRLRADFTRRGLVFAMPAPKPAAKPVARAAAPALAPKAMTDAERRVRRVLGPRGVK